MAKTPEGKIKELVKRLLLGYTGIYSNHPVPAGYGTPMLDVIGCWRGHFFAIETKAKGKKPTRRQSLCIHQMTTAGAKVFVVDGEETLKEVEEWLDYIADTNPVTRESGCQT